MIETHQMIKKGLLYMEFKNEYYYLSNMYGTNPYDDGEIYIPADKLIELTYDPLKDYIQKHFPKGKVFSCVECAYQTLRCSKENEIDFMMNLDNGYTAKSQSKTIHERDDWDIKKEAVMEYLVREKFIQHPKLQEKIKEIRFTIKNETPYDFYWGKNKETGKGYDKLGRILNTIRKEYIPQEELHFNEKDNYTEVLVDFLNSVKDGVFFVVDTETSGLSSEKNDIIELSAIKVDGNTFEILDEFDSFINIGYKLSKEILAFNEKNGTGINDELLEYSPSQMEVCKAFEKFVGPCPHILGQNIVFDIPFIEEFYRKTLRKEFHYGKVADTLVMAKEKVAGSHKLCTLYDQMPEEDKDKSITFHKSIDDIKGTLVVFKWLAKKYDLSEEHLQSLKVEKEQTTKEMKPEKKGISGFEQAFPEPVGIDDFDMDFI